jgi:hypothetical protein
MFIFNTDILLINVNFFEGLIVIITTILAMLAFCSAIQNYIIVKNKLYETIFLIIISFSLFRPDFWLDKYQAPFFEMPGVKIYELLKDKNNILISDKKQLVRVEFQGPDFDNPEKIISQNSIITFKNDSSIEKILENAGLYLIQENDNVIMEEPLPGSPLFQEMKTFDFYSDKPVTLKKVFISNNDRISKEIFYVPSLFLLLLIYLNQYKRRRKS